MKKTALLLCAATIVFASCREDEPTPVPGKENAGGQISQDKTLAGVYILNEGNYGANTCTLDFLDLTTGGEGTYLRNIYAERNPSDVKELGDTGNDIKVYGSQLWMVVNGSNKVVVARSADAVKIGQVDIPNCRSLAFHGGYAYVSSYTGGSWGGKDNPRGTVYKVDTASVSIVARTEVGYQPEEMAVVDGKLYVANSGGYQGPDYETTVSVVDLAAFREEGRVETGLPNLDCLAADHDGRLWVVSRGDYATVKPSIAWLEKDAAGRMALAGTLPMPVSGFDIVGDSLYYYNVETDYATQTSKADYGIINVKTRSQVAGTLFDQAKEARIALPYGLAVNPKTRDFYIMDAKNYTSSGELLHFGNDGKPAGRLTTGDVPGHAAFVWK